MISLISKKIRDKEGYEIVSLGIIGDLSFYNIDNPSVLLFKCYLI